MVTAEKPRVILDDLLPWQQRVDEDESRFKVLAVGRRGGKTEYGVGKGCQTAISGGRVWWVAPTYKIALEGWMRIKRIGDAFPGAQVFKGEMTVEFPSGGSIQVRSTQGDSLRGAGLDGLILDEAAFMPPDAWNQALRPALSDRQGWAIFISTPNGHNWFWELWEQAHSMDGWAAWRMPTSENPHIHPDEIAMAKRQMAPADFAQEYEASFEAISNMVWPHFSRDKHCHDLQSLISAGRVRMSGRGAFGHDFGMTALSTHAVLEFDSAGRVWVREVWAKPGGDEREFERTSDLLVSKWCRDRKLPEWPHRADPTQFMTVNHYKWNGAAQSAGSREQRMGVVGGLLQTGIDDGPLPALCFDIKGPGVLDAVREIEFYHWEKDSKGNLIPCRESHKQDDRVVSIEYGCEQLVGLPNRFNFESKAASVTWGGR